MVVDSLVESEVRRYLGPLFDDLLAAMLDLAVAPIFLFGDDHSRLVAPREKARRAIEQWAEAEPCKVTSVVDRLPSHMDMGDPARSLLEGALWTAYFSLSDAFEPSSSSSRVMSAVRELSTRIDDDGLVDVSGLDAQPHGLLVGEYSLHYHQLMRRSFASNIHYDLVSTILATASRHGATARLAIDERRLRRRDEHTEIQERDYWYGRVLSEDVLDDPHAIGETVYGDAASGSSLLYPYAALSIRWTSDGHLKGVEIEEYVPRLGDDDRPWILARYLHAIRDTTERSFVHCDGAVKGYLPETYPVVQQDFARRGKSDRYRKVFRIDGSFPADAWSAIASQWFRGNRLILEYLSCSPATRPAP